VEGQETEEEKPSGPTLIISEELAFYPDENRAEFLGDVLVEGPAFQLGADRMDVYLTKSGNGEEEGEASSSSQLQKVVADGFVELTQPGWRATGDHAEYSADPGNVVFRGDPVVRSGEDILSGDVIEVELENSVLKCGPNARLWISDAGDTRTVLWAESGTAENAAPEPAAGSERTAGSDADTGEAPQAVARPIEIFSDQLEFRVLENRGRFLGNVRVTSADIRMQADRMDILLATIRDKRVLREVACFGRVKIIQGDRWATSERARYDAFEEMVELLDHPQLTGKDWALTAQRITFYLNDDQLYAEPSPRLLAYPSEIPDWVLREQAKSQIEKTTDGEASETHLPIPGDQPTWTGEDQMRIGEVPSVRR
jgi:lipopolysaccharide transport protein LptA